MRAGLHRRQTPFPWNGDFVWAIPRVGKSREAAAIPSSPPSRHPGGGRAREGGFVRISPWAKKAAGTPASVRIREICGSSPYGSINPSRQAKTAACVRSDRWSLPSRLLTWALTVRSVI